MSAEQIREMGRGPIGVIVSVILGSLFFNWQVKKWSRWIPVKCGEKGRDQLLKEHKTTIRIAKALCIAGCCFLLLCLKCGWLNDHDWRVLGLCCLLMNLPIGCIVAANMMHGAQAIKEGMVALAISERTPPGVLIGFIALCFVVGVGSAISLLLKP